MTHRAFRSSCVDRDRCRDTQPFRCDGLAICCDAPRVCAHCSSFVLPGAETRRENSGTEEPSELKPAFLFGALYALVLLAVAAAKHYFGSAGLYIVAIISGLTDLDAITLSTGQLADSGKIEAKIAWRVNLVAMLSNLLFKFGIVDPLGPVSLTKRVGLATAAALAAGIGYSLVARLRGKHLGLASYRGLTIRFGDQSKDTVIVSIEALLNHSGGTSLLSDFSGTFSVLPAPSSRDDPTLFANHLIEGSDEPFVFGVAQPDLIEFLGVVERNPPRPISIKGVGGSDFDYDVADLGLSLVRPSE